MFSRFFQKSSPQQSSTVRAQFFTAECYTRSKFQFLRIFPVIMNYERCLSKKCNGLWFWLKSVMMWIFCMKMRILKILCGVQQQNVVESSVSSVKFDPRVVLHYGVPSTASILAFDCVQRLIAVGTLWVINCLLLLASFFLNWKFSFPLIPKWNIDFIENFYF